MAYLGDTCTLGIWAFCYMLKLFSGMVLYRSMVNWIKWAFVYVNSSLCVTLFGVVVLHRSIVNWEEGVHLPLVHVLSTMCQTYLV